MHYYQFNIGDYASHTRHLTIIEDIAYRRLLDEYYLHERPLNVGIASVARQINMRDYEIEVEAVLKEFFILTDNGWINDRADREISHYQGKKEKASIAGKASAQRRLNGRSTDVQPTNNHKPITNNQEPITTSKTLAVAKAPATRGARLPDDWFLPKAWGEWALEQGWEIEAIRLEADKFGDYWRAKSGKDACKRDWFATWKNWIRNAKKPPPLHHHQTKSFADTHTDKSWAEGL